MPPPYAFAPLEELVAGKMKDELLLNVDDDAVH
jgi:hypothetical protein